MLRLLVAFVIFISFSFGNDFESFENEFNTPSSRYDPLKGYNEAMTNFNDFVYVNLLSPVAHGYNRVIEEDGRVMIDNFFHNLAFPMRFVNNILQGKFKNSADEFFRFLVNTTIGVGGFGDAGDELFGIKPHNEDFGQTLGFYGVDSGIAIVLPFIGPSNLRDMVGLVGDYALNPMAYFHSRWLAAGLVTEKKLNTLSLHVKEIDAARKNVVNLYPFLQSYYEKQRDEAIKE